MIEKNTIPADWSNLSDTEICKYIDYLLKNINGYTLTRRGYNTIIIGQEVKMCEIEGSHGYDYINANGALLWHPHKIYVLYGTCEELIEQNQKNQEKEVKTQKGKKQSKRDAQMALLKLLHVRGEITDVVYQKYAINKKQ